MSEILISEFIDRTGIVKDKKFFLDSLNEIYDTSKKLSELKIGLNTDKGLSATIKDIQSLRKEYENLIKTQAEYEKGLSRQRTNSQSQPTSNQINPQNTQSIIANTQAVTANVAGLDSLADSLFNLQGQLNAVRQSMTANNNAFVQGLVSESQFRAEGARLTAQEAALKNQINQTRIQLNARAGANNAVSKSSTELAIKLGILRQRYRDLTEAEQRSAQGVALLDEITELRARVEATNQSLGNFHDNVGNYSNSILQSFSRGFSYISRIAAIIPGLGIQGIFLLGFEALEKLLGGLFDFTSEAEKAEKAITQLKNSFDRLNDSVDTVDKGIRAQTQATLTYLKGVGSSAKGILDAQNKGLADQQANFEDGTLRSMQLFNSRLIALRKTIPIGTSEGLNNPLLKDPALSTGLDRQDIGDPEKLKERLYALSNFKASPDFEKLTDTQKKLYEGLEIASKEVVKFSLQANDTVQEQFQNGFEYEAEITKGIREANLAALEGQAKEQQRIAEANVAALQKIYEGQTQEAIEYQKALQGVAPVEAAVKARQAQFDLEKELIEQQLNFELTAEKTKIEGINNLRSVQLSKPGLSPGDIIKINSDAELQISAAKLTENQKAQIQEESDRKLKLLEANFQIDKASIRYKYNEQLLAEEARLTDFIEKEYQKRNQIVKDRQAVDLANYDALTNGAVAYYKRIAEAESGKLKDQKAAIDEITKIEDDRFKAEGSQLLESRKLGLITEQEYQTALQNLKNKEVEAHQAAEDKKAAITKAHYDKIKEYALEAYDIAVSAEDASFERQKERKNAEIALVDAKRDKEISTINQSVSDVAERDKQIAIVEARAVTQKAQLQKQSEEIDRKKANFEKAAALTRIAIETAIDVFKLKALASVYAGQLNFPAAALAVAQIPGVLLSGAFAAAAIAVKKFAAGKDRYNTYEGPAIVGDGGKHEMIMREDGRMELTPKTDTLTWIGRRDIVLPDANKLLQDQFNMAINANGRLVAAHNNQQNSSSKESDIKAVGKDIVRAIKSMPQTNIVVESKLRQWVHSNGSQNNYIN